MEKVKYNIAIQTYMEVFDYLINNGLLVFRNGKDFLKSRITIGEFGFMLETQVARNTWNEENPKRKIVPAIFVLNILTNSIDKILSTGNVPVSPSGDYAYINNLKSRLSGKKQDKIIKSQKIRYLKKEK